MDPEAPKPKDGDSTPRSGSSARERAESLTAKSRPDDSPDKKGEDQPRPALTEKQRIEARRARQARRRRPVEGNPLSKGMRATGHEIRRTASFIGSSVIAALAALGPVFSAVGIGLVWLIEQAGRALRWAGHLIARGFAVLGRIIAAADRVLTPHRALILIAGLAAILLGVSQYKGLGQIEIGQAGYSGFQDLARAPAIDHTTPAGVHTRILVPIAGVALAAVALIALGGLPAYARRLGRLRRLAAMVLVTIGLLTLVVALLVDLPDATDTTEAALAYAGVKARLLSGFWLELAAGAALTVTGLALLLEPAAERAPSSRRESRRSEADSKAGPGRESRASRLGDGTSAMTGGRA